MLDVTEIKKLIDDDYNSKRKQYARIGERYYEAEHDIRKYRLFYYNADGKLQEDTTRANVRISHPFFTELTDQEVAYILSEQDIVSSDDPELQKELEYYFDDAFISEMSDLLTDVVSKGFGYLYGYKSVNNKIAFQSADSMGVVEVRAKDTDDHCEYVIYWYVDRIDNKKIKRIQVWDKDKTYYFVQPDEGTLEPDSEAEINPRPHVVFSDRKGEKRGYGFGFIPFWRLDNNRKQFSGLKPIKGIIDDYDMMECGLSNNLQDFDTPLYVVRGFDGTDFNELQVNLKTKKMFGVSEDGGVEVRTIDVPYQARKVKADEDEKNIYRFGMGLNMFGLKDTAATTNIAIKAAYSLLDLKAKKLETRLKGFLNEIVKVVLDEINAANKTDYRLSDVKIKFDHKIIVNDQESAQIKLTEAQTKQAEVTTILNLANTIDDETVLRKICDVIDVDFEEVSDKVPKQEDPIKDAKTALFKVTPNEPAQ